MVCRRRAVTSEKPGLAAPLTWFEGVSIALLLGAAPAAAQSSGQVFANPPTLQERGVTRPCPRIGESGRSACHGRPPCFRSDRRLYRQQDLESRDAAPRQGSSAQLYRRRRQSRCALRRARNRGEAGPDHQHDAAQQAAGGSELHGAGRQCEQSALLQRHQPAFARAVGKPFRQFRQCPAVDQSGRLVRIYLQPAAGSSGRHVLVPLASPWLDRAAGIERHGGRPDRARRPHADADRHRRHRRDPEKRRSDRDGRSHPCSAADSIRLPERQGTGEGSAGPVGSVDDHRLGLRCERRRCHRKLFLS